MNRIITAIIEQIQMELPVDVLAEFYVNIFSDVAVGTADADAQFTYALTVGDLRDVGAFWLHPELASLVVPEVTGRLLHDMYGKLAIAAASEAGDVLAVASAASDDLELVALDVTDKILQQSMARNIGGKLLNCFGFHLAHVKR
mgnify:CR=1 FL=1